MATCDPQALLNAANCFDCLTNQQLEQVQVQMLCDIVNGGLAGGPFVRISGDTMTGQLFLGGNLGAAGYTLDGNSTSGGNLTLDSTSHATKGNVIINPTGGNAAVGTTTPNYAGWTKAFTVKSNADAGIEIASDNTGNGSFLGGFSYIAVQNTAFKEVCGISAVINGATVGAKGADLRFYTMPDNGTGLVFGCVLSSTGHFGIGTPFPNANAILDLVSTTLGFKLPTMTSAQKGAIANTAGLMVFDTDLGKACINNGAGWQTITSV